MGLLESDSAFPASDDAIENGLESITGVPRLFFAESGVPRPPLSTLGGLAGAGRRGLRDCREGSTHIIMTLVKPYSHIIRL